MSVLCDAGWLVAQKSELTPTPPVLLFRLPGGFSFVAGRDSVGAFFDSGNFVLWWCGHLLTLLCRTAYWVPLVFRGDFGRAEKLISGLSPLAFCLDHWEVRLFWSLTW